MKLLFFEIPVFFLIAGKGRNQFLISLAVFAVTVLIGMMISVKKRVQWRFEIRYPLASSLISLALAVLFFQRWHTSGRIQVIANLLEKPLQQTAILVSLLLALFSLVGIDHLLKVFTAFLPESKRPKQQDPNEKFIILFIILTAFLTMFLNSKCSPLYPFNDWVDPNGMFTVGKGVLKGYVPYRDLYDQKGPLLHFIHTFGAAVSYDTFIGIWLLELIACFFFLYFSWKSASLYLKNQFIPLIPFLAAAVYSPYAFRTGDTGEEFALPLLAYALYVGFKRLKAGEFPSNKEFLVIGLTSGAVFWMKYSMLGFYAGWFLVFFIQALKQHKIMYLLRGCAIIFCGIFILTIPIIIYFSANRSLEYLIAGYFTDNFKYYTQDYSFSEKMRIGIWSLQVYFPVASIIAVLGFIWLGIRRQWKCLILAFLSAVLSFTVIYYASVRGPYYCLPLGVFTILGFCALADLISLIPALINGIRNNVQTLSAGALLTGMLLLCLFSDNLKFLEYPRNEMFQYQMKKIIEESGIENPTVFCYKVLDVGVNTAAGLIPDIRFFMGYNYDDRPDIKEEQTRYIEEQIPDFIIARTKFDDDYPIFDTYEYQGSITGMADQIMQYFHYYTPKRQQPAAKQ